MRTEADRRHPQRQGDIEREEGKREQWSIWGQAVPAADAVTAEVLKYSGVNALLMHTNLETEGTVREL